MRYLLDTHTFIWAFSDPSRLSAKVSTLIRDRDTAILISLVSIWEMQIKLQTGRLTLPAPLKTILEVQQQINQIELLSISLPHILALAELPDHHRDPFDRLLIAQAKTEGIAILSFDTVFKQYPVQVVW